MSLADDFIDAVSKWIGTPYVTKGCNIGPRGGTDCGHYFLECMIQVLPRGQELKSALVHDHRRIILEQQDVITPAFDKVASLIPVEEMARGDIPIMEFFNVPMQPSVYLGDGRYIYCTRAMGVQEGPIPSNLKKRFVKVYRWNEA